MLDAQCVHDIYASYGLIVSLFLAGLVGGFSHCFFMCSPFVLAQIDVNKNISRLSSFMLIPYHLGRATTYVLLAMLLGSVVNIAFIFSDAKPFVVAPILAIAAVIFVVSAFPKLLLFFPWVTNIKFGFGYGIIYRIYSRLINYKGFLSRYFLGMLLGFMPCGLVVSALLVSATAHNVWSSALAMTAFALGTVPALFIVAFSGNIIKDKYPKSFGIISKSAMFVGGIWLFVLAGNMFL